MRYLIIGTALYVATAVMTATAWYLWAGIEYALVALSLATGIGSLWAFMAHGDNW